MCGIVGVAGTGPASHQMKEFFVQLLQHDEIRGHHATGVAAIDTLSRDLTVEKKAIPASDFIKDKEVLDNLFAHKHNFNIYICLLYTSPSPRDRTRSRMPSSA